MKEEDKKKYGRTGLSVQDTFDDLETDIMEARLFFGEPKEDEYKYD